MKHNMILSASGWRKVFAISGDEQDKNPEISSDDIKISITDLLIYTTISSQAEQIKRLQEGEMSSTSSNQTKEVETQKRKRTARKHR